MMQETKERMRLPMVMASFSTPNTFKALSVSFFFQAKFGLFFSVFTIVADILNEVAVVFKWQQGDVVLIDNR